MRYLVFILLFPIVISGRLTHTSNKISDGPEFWKWAQTPPMGWNSWDCFGPTVTEKEVKANADYMATHLLKFGWEYVVVDIRWYVENTKAHGYNQTDPVYTMDKYGRFLPAVNKFPSAADGKGFKPLADYIHAKGLKFGIHLMRGIPVKAVKENTPILGTDSKADDIYSEEMQCRWLRDMYTVDASRDGAQEYYNSLFNLYASWGVDYVKVDDLSSPYHQGEIELIRHAIDQCGRPMVLSLSPGATPLEKAEHVETHANLWRISGDFWDNWRALKPQFELCKNWSPYIGPGHWPDADMLPLGHIAIRGERGNARWSGFSHEEQFTLMNLWAMFRSPLMFGGNLPDNDNFTLSLLTNKDLLDISKNSSNNRELKNDNGFIVWTADIPGSEDKYVALFNITEEAGDATVGKNELNMNGPIKAKNLWTKKITEMPDDGLKITLAPHSSAIFRLLK